MKNTAISILVLLLATLPAHAVRYGWSISASDVDPHVHTGGLPVGVSYLYLWYEFNLDDGMSSAAFGVVPSSGLFVLSFEAMNGFLNAGNATTLLLVVAGCPTAPLVAGRWTLSGQTAGPASLCISPAPDGSRNTVDCSSNPSAWPIRAVGWDALSPPTCDERILGELLCAQYCHGDFCVDGFCQTVVCVECGTCPPCNENCPPISVSQSSWGRVKSLYR